VRTPGQTPQPFRMCLPDEAETMRCRIPHLYSLPIGSTSQFASVRTPCHAQEDHLGILKSVDQGVRGWVPQTEDPIYPARGDPLPIWTPSHPFYDPGMAVQHSGWRCPSAIPNGHLPICVTTDQVCAIWTPGETVEINHTASGNMHTPSVFDIPHTQGTIC